MIEDKTVLILGAGASRPYGYPTMDELRVDIINNFKSYYVKYLTDDSRIHRYAGQIKELRFHWEHQADDFIEKFENSHLIIDDFLAQEDNEAFRKIGKIAIACSIVKHEITSRFGDKSQKDHGDWYTSFFRQLTRALPQNNKYKLWDHSFSVITFNYDRSLEQFLFNSVLSGFGQHGEIISDKMNTINIIHIYGQLLKLSWQNKKPWDESEPFRDYREIDNYEQIKRCASNIEIMIENRQESNRVKYSKKIIKEAKRLIFLGFGFDDFNMKTLGIPELLNDGQDVYWTELGLNDRDKNRLVKLFRSNNARSVRLPVNGNCLKLIEQYLF